jgi:clan AA aspartic protease (TIGR02281 family)
VIAIRKHFFFEKKKQKTFANWGSLYTGRPKSKQKTSFLLAGLALLANAAASQAAPCTLALNSQLDLQPETALVPVMINKQPAWLQLDTGSFTTVLTTGARRRLHVHVDPDKSEHFRGVVEDPWHLWGVGGARAAEEIMAQSLDLGALHGRNFHLLSADIDFGPADGLLSIDFLADYDIDLDTVGRQVRLYQATGACSRPKVFLQPPLYVLPLLPTESDKRPRISVSIEGHGFTGLIDTGASHTAIFRHAAEQLGVSAENASDRHLTVHGIGPDKVAAARHVFESVTIGDLTIRNMPIAVLDDRHGDDVDVLLGRDFQRKMHVWISNSSGQLVLQYPPQASPAAGAR